MWEGIRLVLYVCGCEEGWGVCRVCLLGWGGCGVYWDLPTHVGIIIAYELLWLYIFQVPIKCKSISWKDPPPHTILPNNLNLTMLLKPKARFLMWVTG